MERLRIICVVLLVIGIPSTQAHAIITNPTFNGFETNQQEVINAAIGYWATMLGGDHEIDIDFIADNSLGSIGSSSRTDWWNFGRGTPESATIRLRTNDLSWTTGSRIPGTYDAMHVTMHEIGHSVGFMGSFLAHYEFWKNIVDEREKAFYDLNNNSRFDSGTDFELRSSSDTSHAAKTSDLMYYQIDAVPRAYPTYQHAGVLTDAYGYGVMLQGFGGDAGFGELVMGRNDDGSSSRLDLPFEINFFGNTYDTFFVNNNGNLTFESPLAQYTPEPFPIADQPMIAPYWADVDTRPANGGEVYAAAPNGTAVSLVRAELHRRRRSGAVDFCRA